MLSAIAFIITSFQLLAQESEKVKQPVLLGKVSNDIIENASIEYSIDEVKLTPKIGIFFTSNQDSIKEKLKITNNGVLIDSLIINGSLYNSGIKKYDLITKINESVIAKKDDIASALKKYTVGETVEITYLRENVENKIKVKLKNSKLDFDISRLDTLYTFNYLGYKFGFANAFKKDKIYSFDFHSKLWLNWFYDNIIKIIDSTDGTRKDLDYIIVINRTRCNIHYEYTTKSTNFYLAFVNIDLFEQKKKEYSNGGELSNSSLTKISKEIVTCFDLTFPNKNYSNKDLKKSIQQLFGKE